MNHSQSCQDEEDCGKWMQCCETSCGRRCVHSFMGQQHSPKFSDLTAGHCPAPHRLSTMCELRYGELCEDDDDCYAWQTCCNTTCGRRCVHVFHGKGGDRRCPESSRLTHICTMSFNTQCHNDSDCDGWQTCCNSSCGNRCVPKFLTRSTQCPASSRLDNFCELKLGDVCESDADCLAWSSCCDAECGKRCVPRFFMSRDDTCPAPHRLTPMCDLKLGDQCSGDDDCDAWQTCCDTKCGKLCITSFMDDDEGDECPDSYRARRICASNSSESCNDDEDCSSWKQCCDIGCGKKCVYSRWHKESDQCPSSSSLSRVCSLKLGDECEEDADCDHWQMCCDAGCGKRCVFKFFKGENGSCPAPSRLRPMCDVNYGKDCEDNDDCDLWLTCCDAGCGKRCVHRAFGDGKSNRECPEISTTQHICDKGEAEKCERDEDCTGWKKCCQVGDCGKRCVYTFHKKEEVFECPAESRLTPICQMKLGNRCSSDDDCDIWQSCCEAGCGNRCVMKLKFEGHGGTCPHSSRLHYVCKMNFTAPCENDDTCGHWASCCKTECGPRCVPECLAKKPTDQCPTEDRLSIFCQMSTGDSCEENKDCDAFHTCCDADCGKKCIPKCFTGVNGTCPVSRRLTMMCDMTLGNDCSNDTQCDIWQMCCKTSCGAKCVPTFINKFLPKKCPEVSKVSSLCKKNVTQSCEDDDDCRAYQQCCDIGCGKKCLYSFTQGDKPGECFSPSQLSYVCNSTMGKACSSESDCGKFQTCCFTPCGTRCVYSFSRGDDGQCPRPEYLARVCNSTFGKVCESDGDCSGSQSCCDAGCQKRCVPSSFGKSNWGSSWSEKNRSSTDWTAKKCPDTSSLDRVCRMNHSQPCQDEEDCGKWMQCCETSCGRRCVHSFMGQQHSPKFSDLTAGHCPAPHRLSTMCELRYGELCEDDDDCYAWQTCCNTTCGRRCVHVFHGKGGDRRCPESSRLTHICTMSFNTQCHNDSDCDGWQTCCNSSCGNRCVPKFLTRSTQCPASSRLDNFCELKLGDVCESDADCLAWSSCCDAECGKRCVPRFFMSRDDTCPAPHRLTPMCDLKLGDQCSGDDDCDAWQTCCDTKCGKVCITSFMDDDEGDECPDSHRARRICASNSSESCNDDEDCSSWEQCCDIGCGKKCVYSRWHKESDQCPSSSSLSRVCSLKLGDECEEDADCDHWQMCCDAGCGKRCVFKFFKGENGSCPAPSRLRPMCDVNYGKDCEDNDDCDLWLTCCDAGCGKRCVHRAFGDGKSNRECPEISTTQHICDKGEAEKCERDEDCTGWKKCCQVGDCGKRCVYTFHKKEEVFECPAESRLTPICQMKLGNRCSSDDDCDIWQSCCEAGCGNRCVMKLKFEGHGGTCPHSSRLHYVCKMNFTAPCENDDSCGHWASCCKTECGPRCVPECLAKKPTDQCPTEDRLSIFCQMSTGDSCEENKDCDAFHTCCDADCGKKCIPKCFTGVNGTCPVSRRLTMMCDMTLGNDCSNDTQCDIWQMCCKTSCGAKCVPTFINKFLPKKCPEVSKVSSLCKKNVTQSCEDDDDCRAYQQCCDIGCGKKCLYSFTQGDKPGECFSPSQLSYVCNSTMGKACSSESDCGKFQTCCFTPCGTRCVYSFSRGDDGQCPRPEYLARVCNSTFGKVCESDGDCSGSQSCCDAGCQKRCVPSSFGKSNWGSSWSEKNRSSTDWTAKKCPDTSSLDRVCRMNHSQSCQDEEDCGKWMQCCETSCGRRCVHSFMGQQHSPKFSDLTAGHCPAPHRLSTMCELRYGELCEDDDDCYAWQTCCNTTCGRRCVHVFHGKGGDRRCPESSRLTHICTMSFNTQCHNDSACDGWQTCCNSSCGNRCVPKFLTRSTQCPASSRLDNFCELKLGDVCESDADCLAWSSCCDAECGKRCVPRFFMSRDDTCPAPHRLTPMCDLKLGDQCSGDDDCDAWQTCCDTKCGKLCITSFMDDDEGDECPDSYRARRICASNSSESCNDDEDCSSWKQCCDIGCGKKCVYSRWHKENDQCPSSSSLSKVCSLKLGDECEEDADCDHWQMCCDAGCGKRCVFKFFKGENGSCPAPSRLRPMCDVNYGKDCEDNDDCDLWLTCCDAGCGKRCVHRAFGDAGKSNRECPELSTTQHICDKGEAEKCERDEDCTGWKKCCQVGDCGKRCVYTFHKKEEVFECPAESRLTPICQMKLGNRCSSDDDCDIWQSCCEAGCGNRCVMKLKFQGHGGTCPHSSRLHYVCKMNFTAPCENDDSCGHWASCCKTECGPRCVPECLAKKPTDQCPTEDRLSIFCQMSTGDSCEENKDCDAFHTCCDADCGKKCIPKCFTGVNGTCPVSRRLTMMCDMTLGNDCSNDTQCDIWQMCCKTSCGAKCVPTFINKFLPKKCPEVSKVSSLCKKNVTQSCEDDDDCRAYQQCCDIGCGKKCLYSFTQGDKPGECFSPSQLSYVCNSTMGKACSSESDCGKFQTCCFTPCGTRCVYSFSRGDDGQCPRPEYLARVCNSTFGKVCESDGDCSGSQSCCDAGCQKRCVPSSFGKSNWGSSWSESNRSSTEDVSTPSWDSSTVRNSQVRAHGQPDPAKYQLCLNKDE
ncbi:uncharacterized protein LOC119951020 [Scyliorhinus canicula]|uniref:uncharacterized protein LOC119951020 n=1 Tax=Scyliorhinus canicula TaxID=7830 RepID=UPI0018F51ED0|nr:uncharacterized protein LOC119951020 [Scyliorhinus canicula]